jgi:putative selenium metabolism protein SsnA
MILRGGLLASLDPPRIDRADLRLDQGRIVERGPTLPSRAGEPELDATDRLILPGLVNAHTHLYSAMARGMPGPAAPPRNFVEVLERVWWRLDRALDEESIYLSGLLGAMEAARSGTTVLVDHHSSPSFIRGSLGLLRRAIEDVGLRSVLCYEVTDRNGIAGREQGLEENATFLSDATGDLTRGLVGAHASFTLSEDSLARIGALAHAPGSGVHIHVAEDRVDVEDCLARYGETLPQRLARHGLRGPRGLWAHCVHLSAGDAADAVAAGGWIAHNPRSNMNNAVGYAGLGLTGRVALGTDGMDQDVLAEMRAAFLKMREGNRGDAYGASVALLAGGHRLAAALFGLPFGALAPGGPADLVVCDYDPPTELHADNLAGHLLFGLDRSHVSSVLVAGRFVLRERRLVNVDERLVHERVRRAASDLWRRMQMLPPVG